MRSACMHTQWNGVLWKIIAQQATSIREKELAEFNEEEKNMLQSIASLGAAVETLSKHQGGSLLQVVSYGQCSSTCMSMMSSLFYVECNTWAFVF